MKPVVSKKLRGHPEVKVFCLNPDHGTPYYHFIYSINPEMPERPYARYKSMESQSSQQGETRYIIGQFCDIVDEHLNPLPNEEHIIYLNNYTFTHSKESHYSIYNVISVLTHDNPKMGWTGTRECPCWHIDYMPAQNVMLNIKHIQTKQDLTVGKYVDPNVWSVIREI